MGIGDVLISGIDWEEEKHHGIVLSQDKPKDIKEWNVVKNQISSIEEAISPVIIRFTREESVDQLIDSLMEVKEIFKSERDEQNSCNKQDMEQVRKR